MRIILGNFHAKCCFRSVGSFSDEGGSIGGHSPKKAKVSDNTMIKIQAHVVDIFSFTILLIVLFIKVIGSSMECLDKVGFTNEC